MPAEAPWRCFSLRKWPASTREGLLACVGQDGILRRTDSPPCLAPGERRIDNPPQLNKLPHSLYALVTDYF